MKKILILSGRYLPGHKDGGPLRTLINLTDSLGKEYEFYIACYDRDHGDVKPYMGIEYDRWNQVGNAKVWYVSEGEFTGQLILKLAEGKNTIYLTGFFEPYGYIPLLLKKFGKIAAPVTVASMGVFSKEALAHKRFKKKVFINVCKMLGMFNDVTWSVTSELEANDVKQCLGEKIKYIVAEDLPRTKVPGRTTIYDGTLRIVFLSRICEHKNISMAIEAVEAMKNRNNVELSIYGPVQEKDYWDRCLKKLEKVHYQWSYGGDVLSQNVQIILGQSDVFILPSKSENYGHVIFEALSVGCIPVISDRTPWNELEKEKIGYETELSIRAFAEKLDILAEMTIPEKVQMSKRCIAYAEKKAKESIENTGYRKIFG